MDGYTTIVSGFSDDIAAIAPDIADTPGLFIVTEETSEDAQLPKVDLAVYVFSVDTLYSSQMLSWFTWIHDHVAPGREYTFSLGGADLSQGSFDALRDVPSISPAELERMLGLKRRDES